MTVLREQPVSVVIREDKLALAAYLKRFEDLGAAAVDGVDAINAAVEQTGEDRIAVAADKAAADADVLLTAADRVAVAADALQASSDADAASASAAQAGADAVSASEALALAVAAKDIAVSSSSSASNSRDQAALSAISASDDAAAASADRVQTGLDAQQTALDVVQTGADRTQADLDAQATAADRSLAVGARDEAVASAAIASADAGQALETLVSAAALLVNTQTSVLGVVDAVDASALHAQEAAASASQAETILAESNAFLAETQATVLDAAGVVIDITAEADRAVAASQEATSQSQLAASEASDASSSAQTAATQANAAAISAGTASTQAGVATTQAGIATTQAGNAASQASAAQISASAAAADRVQTGLDVAKTTHDAEVTSADRNQADLDAAATAADRAQADLDAAATADDRVHTHLDAAATAADRVQVAADRVQTGLDAVATAADRAQTALDAAATASDRVQTGLDVVAADAAAAVYPGVQEALLSVGGDLVSTQAFLQATLNLLASENEALRLASQESLAGVVTGLVVAQAVVARLINEHNLLGTAAYTAASAYASSSQGVKADTALQPNAPARLGGVSNYLEILNDGTPRLVGGATVWDDLSQGIAAAQSSGPGVSLNLAEQTMDFVASANLSDFAILSFQLAHRVKLGSAIYLHLHWIQASNATPNWLMQFRWQRNGQAATTAWTSLKCNTNAFAYTSGTLCQISYGEAITPPAGYAMSDIIQVRLLRDSTNASGLFAGADAYSGTAGVTSFDPHAEMDAWGSASEFVK